MNRLFPYYGAKHAYIRHYPAPRHGHIIEPFAGSAAYAHAHGAENDVTLIEKNPRIAAIWQWLVSVSADELASLPGIDTIEHLDESGLIDGPAREFLKQWMSSASVTGANRKSLFAKHNIETGRWWFTEFHKPAFCDALKKIRHWRIVLGQHHQAHNVCATWFVDPPYVNGGQHYRENCNSLSVDYLALAEWCLERIGDVIVCEGNGAEWLPFQPIASNRDDTDKRSGLGKIRRTEIVYYQRQGSHVPAWNVKSYACQNQEALW